MRQRGFTSMLIAILLAFLPAAGGSTPKGIGLEGDVEVTLDRGDYQPKPMDDRTPLILRLDQVRPDAEGRFTYSFHCIGFEPGTHRLADYLVHPDGTPASDLGETPIEVKSILPPDFKGELNPFSPGPFPRLGGYRNLLVLLAVVWLCGLPALIWLGRRKKAMATVAPPAPPPSYAERLRPFVEAAAQGTLDTSGQAELERLLTGYWRERVAVPDQRVGEALATLKQHPEAGALLQALERWLHRPGGATHTEINRLLEPYRRPTATETREEVRA